MLLRIIGLLALTLCLSGSADAQIFGGGKNKKKTEKTEEKASDDIEKEKSKKKKDKKRDKDEKDNDKAEEEEEDKKKKAGKKEKGEPSFEDMVDRDLGIADDDSGETENDIYTPETTDPGEKPLVAEEDKSEEKKEVMSTGKRLKKISKELKLDEEEANELINYAYRTDSDMDSAIITIPIPGDVTENDLMDVYYTKVIFLLDNGFEEQALLLLKRMHERDPENPDINYWVAYCYMNGYNNYCRALPYLKTAVAYNSQGFAEYLGNDIDIKALPSLYLLAQAYFKCGEYDMADRTYRIYLETAPDKKNLLRPQAELELKQLNNLRESMKTRKRYPVRNLSEINSFYADFAPYLAPNGSELYFASCRNTGGRPETINYRESRFHSDIYVAKRKNGGFGEPEPLKNSNTPGDDVTSGISQDMRNLYFHAYSNLEKSTLYSTARAFDEWQQPYEVFPNTNLDQWIDDFHMADNGNVILFSADLKEGYGGLDIYLMRRMTDGEWSIPENLGPSINTPHDETTPYLHPNGKTLYFSSNGEHSIGGYDIFTSEVDMANVWSAPENLGIPVNTAFDERYFTISKDGHYGYFSRQGEQGDLDIFEVDFWGKDFSESLTDVGPYKRKEYRGGEIWLTNLLTNKTVKYRESEKTGDFHTVVNPCENYRLEYLENGKPVNQETFAAPCDLKEDDRRLQLSAADMGQVQMLLNDKSALSRRIPDAQGEVLFWQVQVDNLPYQFPGFEVNFLDESGKIIRTESIDDKGFFEYTEIPRDQSFRFEVQTTDPGICGRLKVVLTRGKTTLLQDFTYQPTCFR